MIRATKHNLNKTNFSKKKNLENLIDFCRSVYLIYIDYIWSNSFVFGKSNQFTFDIKNDLLFAPTYVDYNKLPNVNCSARLKDQLANMALGAVKSVTQKRAKLLYRLSIATDALQRDKINKKLSNCRLTKPDAPENFRIELSSKCANFYENDSKEFLGFVVLSSLGIPEFNKIAIPVSKYRYVQNRYVKDNDWKMMGSFLISKDDIQIRWKKDDSKRKARGKTVGVDTGFRSIATFSDGQVTPNEDIHGHSLHSICKKLARKKKGSKAFRKAQEHRKSFINWSINQIDFSEIEVVMLEHISNIFFKNKTSQIMQRWTNSIIERKIKMKSEEQNVSVILNSPIYRSQRCSSCGLVKKSQRKEKMYNCSCGNKIDADLNGALNNEIALPSIPFWLSSYKLNKVGFYWNPNGFFNLDGEELMGPSVSGNSYKIISS